MTGNTISGAAHAATVPPGGGGGGGGMSPVGTIGGEDSFPYLRLLINNK